MSICMILLQFEQCIHVVSLWCTCSLVHGCRKCFAVLWHVLSQEAPSICVTSLCFLCMFSALQFRAPHAVQKRGLAVH